MSRYVDIEGDWVDDAVKAYSLGYYDDDEYAIPFEALGSAPSIDIVHCEDCEHYEDNYCRKHDELIEPNEWCSFGERIDNE